MFSLCLAIRNRHGLKFRIRSGEGKIRCIRGEKEVILKSSLSLFVDVYFFSSSPTFPPLQSLLRKRKTPCLYPKLFHQNRFQEIPQKEKSELAQKILKDDLIQPHAVRELNHTLKSIRDLIGKIEEKIGNGEDPAIRIKYLQAKYESLKDLDKKVSNNLRIRQNRLKKQKAPTAVQKRSANFSTHYRKNIEPILSRLKTILRQDTDVYEKGTLKIESKAGFFGNLLKFQNYFDTNVTVGPEKPKLAPSLNLHNYSLRSNKNEKKIICFIGCSVDLVAGECCHDLWQER